MVFADRDSIKSYHEIKILDLPHLKKQGIEIVFKPFLQQMLKAGKCEQRAKSMVYQRRKNLSGAQKHVIYQDDSVEFISEEGEKREVDTKDADSEVTKIDTGFALSFSKVILK